MKRRGALHHRIAASGAAILLTAAGATSAGAATTPTPYAVGTAVRSINPASDGTWQGQAVYLGGYGLGGGTALTPGRPATGILGDGAHVRAFAVSGTGGQGLVVADVETQGLFVADEDGPYGTVAIRQAVAARTGGALPAEHVIVQAAHTHTGADTMGVWGGVPVSYRKYIAQQTEDTIVDAWTHRRAAALRYGTADGSALIVNQLDDDSAHGNDVEDPDVRVLQGVDARGKPLATLMNFSVHPTVLGPDETKLSGDWVQAAGRLGPGRLGGAPVVTMVGTLGRQEPPDLGCHDPSITAGDAFALCEIDDFAGRILDKAAAAVAAARPVRGAPTVDARSYLVQDVELNPVILTLTEAGDPLGAPFVRPALAAPWQVGPLVGSVTASARIGDLLLSAGPGEMYPQIARAVTDGVPAQGHLTAGLAGDQLGYLIAPFRAYPEPIRRTILNQDGTQIAFLDNDNFLFNVSPTIGLRVQCSLLRGGGTVMGDGLGPWTSDPRCLPYTTDLLQGDGADVR
jgi:neutral ceramidase